MAWLVLARLTALAHLAFVVFLVAGGPAALRWPRVLPFHLAALAATVAVNLTGSECPLTAVEQHAVEASGRVPYDGGFISHYLVEPIRPSGIDGTVNLVMLALLCLPTAWAYSTVWRRRHAASARP